jgi:O-succinylbenzoic acid--CoA ligase
MKNLSPEKFLLNKQNNSSKAIISSSTTYSFDQLRQQVLATASQLKNQQISSGDSVGILGQNNVDFVINVLALWQISAVPVPLNLRVHESELNEQLNLANCSTILVQKDFSKKILNAQKQVIEYPIIIDENVTIKGRDNLEASDPAVIIFTSGSTKKSKGVILSFNSLYNSAINGNHLLRYTHSDRWLASLPFCHIGGFSTITRAVLFGIPLIVPDSLSNEDLKFSIENLQPTFISLVSTQLKKFVDQGIAPNPELKNCLIGGGFSDQELVTKAYDIGWPVNNVYGSTETSSFVTALLKDEIIFKPHSVGRAVPTNRIQIFDNDGNELKAFEIGEIIVETNAMMTGYLGDNESNQAIKNGFYYTGDIGYIDEDGYLFIVGRKNYLISTGGENINPEEIENALLDHPLIEEAAVFPLKDKNWGEIVAASVVLENKSIDLSYDEIKTFLLEKISGFKIPKKFFFEEELPKTELGKIQKDKLIDRYKLTSL